MIAAQGRLEEARAAGDAGRPVRALELCARALARLDDEPAAVGVDALRCSVMITQAYQHSALGQVERALAVLAQAQKHDPRARAAISGARAAALVRGGDTERAMTAYSEAIGAARPGDGRVLSAALLNRGWLHIGQGRLVEGRADTERARFTAATAGDAWGVFMAAHNLGYIQFLSGDLPGALASMDAAQQAVDQPPIGMPAMDRARVLLAAGLITEAAEFGDIAVEDFDRNRALSELPDALIVAAETDLLQGEWQRAQTRARQARRLNAKRGNSTAALLAELMELKAAAVGRSKGRNAVPAARTDARRAAQLATALAAAGLAADATTARLLAAEGLLEADDPVGAAAAAGRPGPGLRHLPLSIRLHTRLVAARLELRHDHPRAGLNYIRRGLDDLADFQARFGSQDMQSGAAIHGAALARLGLRTALDGGSPAVILQWLERSRAVTTRLPAVHPPADHELAETLGQLRLATLDARSAVVAGQRDAVLERRIVELRRHVRTRSWTVSGSGTALRPLTLAAVQRLLASDSSDATVIAYLHGVQETHALVITDRRARHVQLDSWPEIHRQIRRTAADLDLLATPRVPAPLMTVAQRSLRADLAHLDASLLDLVRPDLAGGPVIVAAVGPMATLPWGLLPSLKGRAVSVSSSVTAALAAVGRPGRAYLRGVLAVAGPDVPGGAAEAAAVAAMHPGSGLLTGPDAIGEAVLAQLPPGGLLHVAAHGHHEPDSPLFSSIQLADGPLYGYDIAPNPTLPDHVVLSSCDVGRSDDRPGGEPLGLAAALLRSGVSTVVAGVSRISDEVAASTMVIYHERLLAGDGPAVALATAIATVDGAPAPLTCFGAGS